MNKQELIKNLIENIQNNNLVKCLFTDELIDDDNDLNINLYVLINKEHYKLVFEYINDFMINFDHLIYEKYDELSSVYYYDNKLRIIINYLFDFNYNNYLEIFSLYDPFNLVKNFKIKPLPLTNKEYAKYIESLCVNLFDFYNAIKKDDKLIAYQLSKQIENIFVLLYRGYYDSLNAKKHYQDIKETMSFNYYNNLLAIIKMFKYDLLVDAIQVIINEMDTIINNLPINIISLFNFDFYTFTKKLIFSL